ncbi:hypothetical protein Tdes44962_MAKER02353 [Teratosphaeria destructans]|uniref:Uncharacterized protein n=1 Tax=Teratosphaeria destructans TaxID=418781 RepID=A0A9W7W3Q2_9PEZI|nr:hypothetical protein Tdes44962_MAKER02353 [Teratosphaeria destructans]
MADLQYAGSKVTSTVNLEAFASLRDYKKLNFTPTIATHDQSHPLRQYQQPQPPTTTHGIKQIMASLLSSGVRNGKVIKPYRQTTQHHFDHHLLARAKYMVTRSQIRAIRSIFRFLDLPGELRMVIYEYCVDVTAGQNLIAKYYHLIDRELSQNPGKALLDVEAPLIYSSVRTIFLINRQIYSEASSLIHKRGLTFTHGMLDLLDIVDFVRPPLFQNVSSITIDDTGHALFQANILTASWLGQMQLIKQVSDILAKGHQLKQLTIALTDTSLLPHVTNCWNAGYVCGFRDSMRETVASMRKVHNVPSVTLIGFPEPLATELKQLMQEPAKTLLSLPAELRNIIYRSAADWSDVTPALDRTLAKWTDKSGSPPYPPRSTPTILLLNKQITSEALAVLREEPLVIVYPADHTLAKQQHVPNVLKLITRRTLRHVRHLVLDIQTWEWIYSAAAIFPIFANAPLRTAASPPQHLLPPSPTSATTTSLSSLSLTTTVSPPGPRPPGPLRSLHLTYHDALKSQFLRDPAHHYPDATIHQIFRQLQDIRGLRHVSIAGDLPPQYTGPIMRIMRSSAAADVTALAAAAKAVRGDGSVTDVLPRVVEVSAGDRDGDGDVVMSG